MPEGRITTYDPDATSGCITPDDGDDSFAFERSDVVDLRTGEQLRRATPRGYVA